MWLDRAMGRPTPQEAMTLGLSMQEPVVRVSRVRTANGEPIAIEVAVVSAASVGATAEFGESLYAAIRRHGQTPVRAIQRIRAGIVTAYVGQLLGIKKGAPVMEMERHSYSAQGKPLEWTCSTYRGDRYDYVAELLLTTPRDMIKPKPKPKRKTVSPSKI
jgi:GntR family transcriptional regulator